MLQFLALIGSVIVFSMAIDEFPEPIGKTILGLMLLAVALKLAAYGSGLSFPF